MFHLMGQGRGSKRGWLHWSPDWGCLGDQVDSNAIRWYRSFSKDNFGEKDGESDFERIEWEILLYKFGFDLAR